MDCADGENMKQDLVSIIVPVYGVSQYLSECVDSILAQTHHNLEVILVDDGSPDDCGAICDDYAAKDTRVKVIHKANGGAASARNVGLDAAQGLFICLIDGDDWISDFFVESQLCHIKKHNADVSVCSFLNVFQNGETANPMRYPADLAMTQIDYLNRFLSDWTCGMATNKMYKADVLREIRYAEGHKIDDEFFTYRVIMNCRKIAMFDDVLYFYRMRGSSVMSSASEYPVRMLEDKLEYLELRYRDISAAYPELARNYLINLADNLVQLRYQGNAYPAYVQLVKKLMRKYLLKIMLSDMDVICKYVYLCALLRRISRQKTEKINVLQNENLVSFD